MKLIIPKHPPTSNPKIVSDKKKRKKEKTPNFSSLNIENVGRRRAPGKGRGVAPQGREEAKVLPALWELKV
jgi:hypothetical protein